MKNLIFGTILSLVVAASSFASVSSGLNVPGEKKKKGCKTEAGCKESKENCKTEKKSCEGKQEKKCCDSKKAQ